MEEMTIVFQRHEFISTVQYKGDEYKRRQSDNIVDWYKKEQAGWNAIYNTQLYDELEFIFMKKRSL